MVMEFKKDETDTINIWNLSVLVNSPAVSNIKQGFVLLLHFICRLCFLQSFVHSELFAPSVD